MGKILKDLDLSFTHGQHPCLQLFPQEHNQHICTPLPNSKPTAPSWTHPSVLYVSLKYPSWDIRPHPKVPGSPITHHYTCQHPKVSHHSHSLWQLLPSNCPLPPHSYWPCWSSTSLRRILILSHSSGPLYPLARSLSSSRHHQRDSVPCSALWLDILLWLKKDHLDRPRTSVRVPTLPLPGKAMTSIYAGQAPTSPMAKWNAYTSH